MGASLPPLTALCPRDVYADGGKLCYTNASSVKRALATYLKQIKKNKSQSDSDNLEAVDDNQDDILEMSSFDEDEVDISPFPVSSTSPDSKSMTGTANGLNSVSPCIAIWCAVKVYEARLKPLPISLGGFYGGSTDNYGEDEALAPVGHDAAEISAHQAAVVADPSSRFGWTGGLLDTSILPLFYRVLRSHPFSPELSSSALALISCLWSMNCASGKSSCTGYL